MQYVKYIDTSDDIGIKLLKYYYFERNRVM